MLCNGCGLLIADQYVLKIGSAFWHESCVKCVVCDRALTEKCYQKFGMFHCAEDYFKQYSVHRCFVCGYGIGPHHLVYKLASQIICHTQCQRCALCDAELGPGVTVVIDQAKRRLLCMSHAAHAVDKSSVLEFGGKMFSDQPASPTNQDLSNEATIFNGSSVDAMHCGLESGNARGYIRRRGPRTTIRPGQLETLNRIFGSTPKPSKQARARLALETGLSMRVIQVWFQNRRSKERRLKHLCNWIRQNECRSSPSSTPNLAVSSLLSPTPSLDEQQELEELIESESSDKKLL